VRLLVIVALVGCGRAGDQSKNLQDEPPPRVVDIPANASIAVQVDNATKPALTAELLKATKPDFADAERKAWRIATLVPEAGQPGAIVEAASAQVSVKYLRQDGTEPVLYLTRRGDLEVASVDPKDPFPEFHGRGGRRHRPGDQLPRVAGVTRIAITR
jgi:hypothetical protein